MTDLHLIIEPDQDEPGAALPFVDGLVDGKPYRFLLDTGAARSSIIHDDYTATLSSSGKHASSGVFAPSNEDIITIARLEIGPITQQNFSLTRSPQEPGSPTLIGMDILHDFCCHFRFDEGRVSVESDCPPDDANTFEPLRLDNRLHPYIKVNFGTAQANAIWDTGSSITVADLNFIQRQPTFFAEAGYSTGTDATGAQVQTPMFTMSSANIGGHLFPPHRIAAVDLSRINATLETPMDLIIGYITYSQAHWMFDFPAKKWRISRWLGAQ